MGTISKDGRVSRLDDKKLSAKIAKNIPEPAAKEWSLRNALPFLIRYVKYYVRTGILYLTSSLWVIEGEEKENGSRIVLIFLGVASSKKYISSLMFRTILHEKSVGRNIAFKCYYLIFCRKVDIKIVDSYQTPFCSNSSFEFVIPRFIRGEVNISDPVEVIINRSRDLKRKHELIKSMCLDYCVAADNDSIVFFYNHMFLPYIAVKYPDADFQKKYSKILERVSDFELLFVKKGGNYLSGQLIYFNPKSTTPMLYDLGVLEGEEQYVRRGAVYALYEFSIEYIKSKGYKRLSLGYTRSFFNDGVFQNKRRWGFSVTDSSFQCFHITPQRLSPGVVSFLVNNPFISFCGERMVSNIFLERLIRNKDYYQKLRKRYLLNGISGVRVFSFEDIGQAGEIYIPENVALFHIKGESRSMRSVYATGDARLS